LPGIILAEVIALVTRSKKMLKHGYKQGKFNKKCKVAA
jgi:hypothetical protein